MDYALQGIGMLKRLLLIGLLCAPVAAWAFFKPVRVIIPEWAGLSCVNDSLCIDDISRSQEAALLYDEALQCNKKTSNPWRFSEATRGTALLINKPSIAVDSGAGSIGS
jgi:hypothetical protein